ncbi:MAG: hypothetical protein ABFC84_07845 [Veillonellales bacterium]
MKNVYDQVQAFYEQHDAEGLVIFQEWVEGFLRQKAWQGIKDKELQDLWHSLAMFIAYLIHSDHEDLDDMDAQEYSLAIEWLSDQMDDFQLSLGTVRQFFCVLSDFYQYLISRKILVGMEELKNAARIIAGGNKIVLIRPEFSGDELGMFDTDLATVFSKYPTDATDALSKQISETVERLMAKLGNCFQQENFNEDFDRALYLYTGPFDSVPADEQDEFWLGFWDYFLFDYHLLQSDRTPLAYFDIAHRDSLNVDEREILHNLLYAEFTVFYISRVLNQDWVECVNLFTGKTFQLPCPDFDYKTLKRLLFFGHIFSQGMVMINYVTSIEVSANLRRRIKDEVVRQTAIFAIQNPGAGLSDFFVRHAQVVRHTIDVLVTLAKVNVISADQLEQELPQVEEKHAVHQGVHDFIASIAFQYGFSLFDIGLIQKMWYDFCQLTKVTVRKPAVWAAALLYAYSQVNGSRNIVVENLARDLGVAASSVHTNRSKLFTVLRLKKFDPRYLNEEGFIFLIFMP